MKKLEEKINQSARTLKDIQEQIHGTLIDMYDEFHEHTIKDLDKRISYLSESIKLLKKEESNLKELEKENKPIQVYTITLHYEGHSMGSPSPYREYLYISINLDQDLEKVLFNEIEEVWKELGGNNTIRTVIKSDEFIQRLEDKNIYYINDEYVKFKEESIYGNITYKEYKK